MVYISMFNTVVNPVVKNGFDNRLYRVYKYSTGCQIVFVKPVVKPGLITG